MRAMLVIVISFAAICIQAADVKPADLFEPPMALTDAGGKPLITGLAQGCPVAADFNGDGKIDLILGAHESMDTAVGGIWLIPNTGTNAKPAFTMENAQRVSTSGGSLQASCGCKSAGHVLLQAVDWNGDGFMDIVYSDTYAHQWLLLNDGASRDKPVFKQQKLFDMEKTNHGMYAGGGDWTGDGVMSWLHMPFAGDSYIVFKGDTLGGKGLKFHEGGPRAGTPIKISGEKASKCAWAWDFSGTAKARGVIEYVGISGEDKGINLYELKDGLSRKVAVLATFDGSYPILSVGDLNGDGKMDILYSGGDFNGEKDKTKVFVMYGKAGAKAEVSSKK